MSQTTQERNKAIVLEAFDALFRAPGTPYSTIFRGNLLKPGTAPNLVVAALFAVPRDGTIEFSLIAGPEGWSGP